VDGKILAVIIKENLHMKKMKQILLILCFVPIYCIYGQIKMATPFPVQVYNGNNVTSIVYEIHLVDSLKRPVEFLDFTISSEKKILLHDTIYENFPKKADKNRYIKYIWINVDTVPKLLTHKIKYNIGGEIYKFSKDIEVNDVPLVSIGLPVKNGIWYMEDGPSPQNSHRNFTQATKSQYDSTQNGYKLGYSNQRFAIDFSKIGEDGLLYKNKGIQNSDYYCYQIDVIAVADGIVVGVKDSIPDMPHPPAIEEFKKPTDYTGNLVLLDIGNGIIASYAHLLAYSIKVHLGDTLKKGDFIAKIGNSGNSTGPHLHFHLSKPDYLKVERTDIIGMFIVSEGIPYVFDDYVEYHVISGKIIDYEGITELKSEPFIYNQPKQVRSTMPYDKNIIGVKE